MEEPKKITLKAKTPDLENVDFEDAVTEILPKELVNKGKSLKLHDSVKNEEKKITDSSSKKSSKLFASKNPKEKPEKKEERPAYENSPLLQINYEEALDPRVDYATINRIFDKRLAGRQLGDLDLVHLAKWHRKLKKMLQLKGDVFKMACQSIQMDIDKIDRMIDQRKPKPKSLDQIIEENTEEHNDKPDDKLSDEVLEQKKNKLFIKTPEKNDDDSEKSSDLDTEKDPKSMSYLAEKRTESSKENAKDLNREQHTNAFKNSFNGTGRADKFR